MENAQTLEQILDKRIPGRLERLADFLCKRRFETSSDDNLAQRVAKSSVNLAADSMNYVFVEPVLGLILPGDLQETYTHRVNANPYRLTYLSLANCVISESIKLGAAQWMLSFVSPIDDSVLGHIKNWSLHLGGNALKWYAYAAFVDIGLRVSYLTYNRKPVGGMIFEIPYQVRKMFKDK